MAAGVARHEARLNNVIKDHKDTHIDRIFAMLDDLDARESAGREIRIKIDCVLDCHQNALLPCRS